MLTERRIHKASYGTRLLPQAHHLLPFQVQNRSPLLYLFDPTASLHPLDRTTVMAATKPIAIIAGVGSGTGASVARRFAQSYPVVLLARSPSNFNPLVDEINQSGGEAFGISTDVSNEESVKNAFVKIKEVHGAAPVAAVVFNASIRPSRKPFLESTAEDFRLGYEISVYVMATGLFFRLLLEMYTALT